MKSFVQYHFQEQLDVLQMPTLESFKIDSTKKDQKEENIEIVEKELSIEVVEKEFSIKFIKGCH